VGVRRLDDMPGAAHLASSTAWFISLVQLAAQTPVLILASLLGFSPARTATWGDLAKRDWSANASHRAHATGFGTDERGTAPGAAATGDAAADHEVT
jgi:hypothetical protein